MNRNEFFRNIGFGMIAFATGESLLSSCKSGMDMGTTVAPIVTDGEFVNALKIPETVSGTSSLIAQSVQDELLVGKKVNVQGYRNGILGSHWHGNIVNNKPPMNFTFM